MYTTTTVTEAKCQRCGHHVLVKGSREQRIDFGYAISIIGYVCITFLLLCLIAERFGHAEPIDSHVAVKCIVAESGTDRLDEMTAIGETLRNRRTGTRGVYGFKKVTIAEKAWRASASSNLTKGATMFGNAEDVKQWRKNKRFNDEMVCVGQYGKHFFFKPRKTKG